MRSLAVLICAGLEDRAHKIYFANLLWTILQYASTGKSTFPSWADAFPERRQDEDETADDIKQRLIRELRR